MMQDNQNQSQQRRKYFASLAPEGVAALVVIVLGYLAWRVLEGLPLSLAYVVAAVGLVGLGLLAFRFRGWISIIRWNVWRHRLFAAIAKLEGRIAKSPPWLTRVEKIPGGYLLFVNLRNGIAVGDLEAIAENLVSAFKANKVIIHRGDRGDRAIIHVQKEDPLGGPPLTVPLNDFQEALNRDIESIPIGIDESSREISMKLRAGGVVVAGLPGSGKSNLVHLLVAHLVGIVGAKVYLIDPKLVELAGWKVRATRFGTSQEDAINILDEVVVAMEERYRELERLGERTIGIDMAPMLVVIEEVTALLVGQRTKVIEELLRRVMMMGRAAGVLVVLVAQRPGVDTIPASLRDLAETRIAFRTSTPDMSDIILGRGSAARGFDASRISSDTRGVGYLSTGDGEATLMRCYYVDNKTLATLQGKGHLLSPTTGETR